MGNAVYIASVLLEKNRWTKERRASITVDHWLGRIRSAGFDGLELWENHWHESPPEMRSALRQAKPPVRVFNSYFQPVVLQRDPKERSALRETLIELSPFLEGVKFNAGTFPLDQEVEAILAQIPLLPNGAKFYCECHSGTAIASPEAAGIAAARWPAESFGFIVHPLLEDDSTYEAWLAQVGTRLVHAHVQLRDAKEPMRFVALSERAAFVRQRLARLATTGFRGSFTIEFTAKVGAADEHADALFTAAANDLAFLRVEISRLFS